MKKEKRVPCFVTCFMALLFLVMIVVPTVEAQPKIPHNAGPAWPSLMSNESGYPLPTKPIAPCDLGIIVEKNVSLPMRDGVKLKANVFRPDKPGKFPVIMSFTVFHKDVPGWWEKQAFVQPWQISVETSWEAADPGFWVPYGYVVILVDERGYGMSEGCRLGSREGEDYYDGIE